MTFTDSIKTCLSKYADFKGRASRSEYWWFILFLFLGFFILSFFGKTLVLIFNFGMLLPSIAVATRRLHDTNRTGWLQLIGIIPIIGWLILIFLLVQGPKEPNRF